MEAVRRKKRIKHRLQLNYKVLRDICLSMTTLSIVRRITDVLQLLGKKISFLKI